EPGRALDQRLQGRVLRIEDAQRISLESPLAVRIELAAARRHILYQYRAITLARLRGAERVHGQAHVTDTELAPQARGDLDHFRVDVGSREAESLAVDLVKLAVTPLLRAVGAEHGRRGG